MTDMACKKYECNYRRQISLWRLWSANH